MAFDPLLVLYRDPFPILNAFARQYRTGYIVPSCCQLKLRTVEDAIRLIGQLLAAMGTLYPYLKIEGELNICLFLQYQC